MIGLLATLNYGVEVRSIRRCFGGREVVGGEIFQAAILDQLQSKWRRLLQWQRYLYGYVFQRLDRVRHDFRIWRVRVSADLALDGKHRFQFGEAAQVPIDLLSVHTQCSNIVLMGRVNARSLSALIGTAVSRCFAGLVPSGCVAPNSRSAMGVGT